MAGLLGGGGSHRGKSKLASRAATAPVAAPPSASSFDEVAQEEEAPPPLEPAAAAASNGGGGEWGDEWGNPPPKAPSPPPEPPKKKEEDPWADPLRPASSSLFACAGGHSEFDFGGISCWQESCDATPHLPIRYECSSLHASAPAEPAPKPSKPKPAQSAAAAALRKATTAPAPAKEEDGSDVFSFAARDKYGGATALGSSDFNHLAAAPAPPPQVPTAGTLYVVARRSSRNWIGEVHL